jgi:chaperone required for assembly of F1-ATPase
VKRFWSDVSVAPDRGILLDGRPVRTPGRVPLVLPTPALAKAVAAEWRAVGETLDPRAMPLTGLANAAIDRIAPDPQGFAVGIARFGESDLLCYRADSPAALIARDAARWDPLLAWAQHRYDVHFEIASGIVHRPQPAATLARLREAVAAQPAFVLAPLSSLVDLTGSLVIGLALVEGAVTPEAGWAAADIDGAWQREHWGTDPLEAAALAERRGAYDAAVAFLACLRSGPVAELADEADQPGLA